MSNLGNKEVIAKNITYYMERKGITRNKLCDDLGFKYSTVSEWINARKYPRIDYIEKMANYFGIKKSDLIESKDDHPTIDIEAELSAVLARIEGGKSISLHGELLDDTTKELLVDSLTNTLKLINTLANKS